MTLFDFEDLIPKYPKELQAVLVFSPNPFTKTKKVQVEVNGTIKKVNRKYPSSTQPIPSWNEYVDLERGRNGYKGREFVRLWNDIGYNTMSNLIKSGNFKPEQMKYSKIDIAIFWSDYVKRDIINTNIKHIVDGIKRHHIWDDDDAIIDLRIALAGMSKEPAAYMYIYKLHVPDNDPIIPPRKREVEEKPEKKRKPVK